MALYCSCIVVGDSNGAVYMYTLENYQLSRPIITSARLWLFDLQRLDSNLTAQCSWCGTRFVVKDEWIGQDINCPLEYCGKPLKLYQFVWENGDWLG